jgi:hypothetical protein
MRLSKNTNLIVFAMLAFLSILAAAEQRGEQLRNVSGKVVGGQDQPLAKAVVHLKNTRTLVIKTYITEADGAYRFSALAPNVDYEIFADHDGSRSDTKTVSAFDNRKELTLTLKIRGK